MPKLYNVFINPSPASTLNFNLYRNAYNKVLRAAKKLYFEHELFINQSNVKQTWNLIRLAMNKKSEKSSFVSCLSVNNRTVNDHSEMANLFNEFFTSVSAAIVEEINQSDRPPDEDFSDDIPLFSFSTTPLTIKEVVEAALQLQPKKRLTSLACRFGLSQKLLMKYLSPFTTFLRYLLSKGLYRSNLN